MVVSDNIRVSEGRVGLFKILGKKGLNVSKKRPKNVFKNPGLALENTANIAAAAASRKPKNVMSKLLELITFYNTV